MEAERNTAQGAEAFFSGCFRFLLQLLVQLDQALSGETAQYSDSLIFWVQAFRRLVANLALPQRSEAQGAN